MSTSAQQAIRPDLPRSLGLLDATNIVIGTMIGSAIFIVPNTVAQSVQSSAAMLGIWLLAGVLSLFGALAYAELGAMMPETGGQYVYLREAWGPLWAFLCGWTFFLAARSGGTASVAVGFSLYLSHFFPMPQAGSSAVAAGLILLLTFVNYRGVRFGATVQNIFTGLKVLGLVALIVSMFLADPATVREPALSGAVSPSALGTALIVSLWAYNGWFAVSLVSGEIKNPQRNVPLAVLFGTGLVMLLYLLANVGYLMTLGVGGIASNERVASAAAQVSLGRAGSGFVALIILVSTFGTANANIMTAPRIYFAQARDGLFFRSFGEIHTKYQTPYWAILGQGVWCAVLAITGSYVQLVSYAVFAFWIFYGMTAAGLIVLRRKYPDATRPYRMFGYPVTTVLFVGVAVWIVVSSMVLSPNTSIIGVVIIGSGVPVYYLWRRHAIGAGRLGAH